MNKTVYLYLNDLVGNLFITLKKTGYDTSRVSFSLIESYKNILAAKLYEKDITAKFILSRNDTYKFIEENQDLYNLTDDKYIELINNITLEELISKYHGYLPLEVLLTITDHKTIAETITIYEHQIKEKKKIKKIIN